MSVYGIYIYIYPVDINFSTVASTLSTFKNAHFKNDVFSMKLSCNPIVLTPCILIHIIHLISVKNGLIQGKSNNFILK